MVYFLERRCSADAYESTCVEEDSRYLPSAVVTLTLILDPVDGDDR